MTDVAGFRVAGVSAGLKASGALDMALIVSDSPCSAAGVFTTNLMKAAPVLYDQDVLSRSASDIRAVVVNTRCANACTGALGLDNARSSARLVAEALHLHPDQVLVLSTGVIGTHLPMDAISRGIRLGASSLGKDWPSAATAIMTTDTRPKLAARTVQTATGTAHITGIAKGAGMIAPNMATMLSVITTDAMLTPDQAHAMLREAAEVTFNRIVVDGDMSTNDTVLLLANGVSGASGADPAFAAALREVCLELAQAIVRDGEGATKFVTVNVNGAADEASARTIANAIATSPLVKTALYGGDANWGRIVAAAGRAGVTYDPGAVRLWISPGTVDTGALLLFEREMPTRYDEAVATAIVGGAELVIRLSVGDGPGASTLYTCDLSHDYVSVNGSYRS